MILLSHTVGKSVFRNQNHSQWENCPPIFENALSKIFLPVILPHGGMKVSVTDFRARTHTNIIRQNPRGGQQINAVPLFFCCLFFLLELNQIGGLAVQEPTEGFKVFPRHALLIAKLLERGLTEQSFGSDLVCVVAFFFQSIQYVDFITQWH